MPRLFFTVTNDLTYDQRMIRIATSLTEQGYDVLLIGRAKKNSQSLSSRPFRQHRIPCFFEKGPLFYIEYNIRLFFFLLFKQMDVICAIDLDSILPCLLISKLKGVKRVYDAHELFCEMKEIVSRPRIYAIWKKIERFAVPRFPNGYTVNDPIAAEFENLYGCKYETIRSMALYDGLPPEPVRERYILYQGAVNEGRSFETLIPAMQWVDAPLLICGDGNFMEQARELVRKHGLESRVIFKGMLPPENLKAITRKAMIGVTLFEKGARSNYFSLANRFFDYMQAAVPQVCVDFPVYRGINNSWGIAVLIDDLSPEHIARSLNSLLTDSIQWEKLKDHCVVASKELNWQNEEKKLISFYKQLIG